MIKVRQARTEDVPWLLKELAEFSKFYGTKNKLFGDQDYNTEYIEKVMDQHFILVSENDEELTGFIAGLLMLHPFNPKVKVLQELWWWVPEKFRGGRSGFKLFKDFCDFGDKYCDMTLFTLEDASPVSETMLTKRGFVKKEVTYVRESEWPQ